ncbi:glycosyltransferase family 39 protein [Thermoleptolyngbya sichuanensis XZ-Cy5]|uniref:ArnT family glycosyltransferase n=1 Tax=Thermoleptolyngbya sichuanensis TaxID=2885951 RepID=UPI00240E7E9F|nr:glycosyltransferase family 39 protein [Thermoleptolyngbya sichuanensis]MDG2616363.1 glycosyltransferase family 39 protein [Thermoleptolyngbya sichuanensis XZ-Cy5]
MTSFAFPHLRPWLQHLDKRPMLRWGLVAAWLGLLCGLGFFWQLGSIGLVDETEPLFAEATRQMVETGDWITPYFNEKPRFDKPPLIYWLMAIAYKTLGVNEWAVRLPSALSAAALVVFGFFTLLRFGYSRPGLSAKAEPDGEEAIAPSPPSPSSAPSPPSLKFHWFPAVLGSGLMALNLQTIAWARTGVSDMLLSACVGGALLAFFWGYAASPDSLRAKERWYLAFFVLCGLGVLTKGPVGVVLPGATVAAFLLYLGNGRTVLRDMRPVRGGLVFLAIALPWYILVTLANGDKFINAFFGYHNVERFTRVVNQHRAPWYFYVVVLLVGFAPYSAHLPAAIARLRFWRRSRWQAEDRRTQLGLFALIWAAVIFGFFTIAVTKLPSYVLPLYPAIAILVALFWSDLLLHRPRAGWGMALSHGLNLLLLAALAIASYNSAPWLDSDNAVRGLEEAITRSGLPIMGTVIWGLALLGAIALLIRRQGCWLWGVNLAAMALTLLLFVFPLMDILDIHRQLPLRQLAAEIVEQQQPDEPIMMAGLHKPSLVFYGHRPIFFAQRQETAIAYIRRQSRGQGDPPSMLLVGLGYKIEDLNLPPEQMTLLAEAGKYDLVRLQLPVALPPPQPN